MVSGIDEKLLPTIIDSHLWYCLFSINFSKK